MVVELTLVTGVVAVVAFVVGVLVGRHNAAKVTAIITAVQADVAKLKADAEAVKAKV